MALTSGHAGNGRIEIFVMNKEGIDEITWCDNALADHASNGGGFSIAAGAGSLYDY